MTTPTMTERDSPHMEWFEFANYLRSKNMLTKQQAHILAGKAYDTEDAKVAEECGTTVETIRSQRSQVNLEQLDPVTTKEIWKTPVPNVPFRRVGKIEYLLTDEWPREANGGEASIYYSVKPEDTYVAVVEDSTVTDESPHIDSEDNTWAISERRERTTIYPTFEDFRAESPHAPQRVSDDGLNVESYGPVFE